MLIGLASWHPGAKAPRWSASAYAVNAEGRFARRGSADDSRKCQSTCSQDLKCLLHREVGNQMAFLNYVCAQEDVRCLRGHFQGGIILVSRDWFSPRGWIAVLAGNFIVYCPSYLSRGLWCRWVKFASVACWSYSGFTLVLQNGQSGLYKKSLVFRVPSSKTVVKIGFQFQQWKHEFYQLIKTEQFLLALGSLKTEFGN